MANQHRKGSTNEKQLGQEHIKPLDAMTKSAMSVRSELGVIRRTSYIETLIHFIKGYIGSGVFAMGDAMKNAGLLFGTIAITLLGAICLYNEYCIVECATVIRKKLNLPAEPNMPETIELCFKHGPLKFRKIKNFVRVLVKMFVITTQLGFCSVYFIFVSSTMQTIMKHYDINFDVRIFMAISLIPIMLSVLIRSLKFLTPISFVANVLILSGICMTLYVCTINLPNISERRLISDVSTWPLFFGTTIYSFEGISLVIPLHNDMKNQKYFISKFGVLNIGQALVVLIMILMGFMSYLKYGDDILGSVTLNLETGILSEVIMGTVALAILLTYAIQFHVAVDLIWWDLVVARGPFKHMVLYEILVRIGLVLVTFIFAAVIPHLNLFISLIGAMCSSFLALVFPSFCDIALRLCPVEEGRLQSKSSIIQVLRIFFDIISMIVAAIGFGTGTYYSLKAIIEAFWHGGIGTHS